MRIRPDELAYWYLRLNGFLTTVNFVVHPDIGGSQRTDVDILGVRFPFRSELVINPMEDDARVINARMRPTILIAEVKRGRCGLNGPWTNLEGENMERVVRSIGLVAIEDVRTVSSALYTAGFWEDKAYHLSLACFGSDTSASVSERYPRVLQITWNEVLGFIFDRFRRYRSQKVSHPQWDNNGQNLWNCVFESSNTQEMMEKVELII